MWRISVVKIPYGIDDYAVAGGLAHEPVALVRAKTVDIEVPANAEIVIDTKGEVLVLVFVSSPVISKTVNDRTLEVEFKRSPPVFIPLRGQFASA